MVSSDFVESASDEDMLRGKLMTKELLGSATNSLEDRVKNVELYSIRGVHGIGGVWTALNPAKHQCGNQFVPKRSNSELGLGWVLRFQPRSRTAKESVKHRTFDQGELKDYTRRSIK